MSSKTFLKTLNTIRWFPRRKILTWLWERARQLPSAKFTFDKTIYYLVRQGNCWRLSGKLYRIYREGKGRNWEQFADGNKFGWSFVQSGLVTFILQLNASKLRYEFNLRIDKAPSQIKFVLACLISSPTWVRQKRSLLLSSPQLELHWNCPNMLRLMLRSFE